MKNFALLMCSLCVLICGELSANTLTADRSIIVDCLLPGKVRQLGVNRTYVARKRPTKTSANDCEIKGGDYVKYDRATLATSLNVWQESASQGDAQAQYFVGEIFEKGMGQAPDYEMAVMWYQRAVKQDYTPAKMSLGRLHELGLGVPKDLVKAMNLYREASGLDEDEIAYASVFEAIQQQDQQRILQLQQALDEQTRKAGSLRRQSEVLRSDLQRSQQSLKKLKSEADELKSQLNKASQETSAAVEAQLTAKLAELESESKMTSVVEERLARAEQALKEASEKIASLTPTGDPEVVLKWPEFNKIGEVNVSTVPAGSIVNVVGAVDKFTSLKSFKINGIDYSLDTNGLFLKSLDVGREPVDLLIEMVDANDKLISTQLSVEPSDDINIVMRGTGSLTRPKFELGTYHALVIGNNKYDMAKGWEPLDTAENDATEIARTLEQEYGFKVRLELNADRDTMLTAIEEMRKTLTARDNLLIYYAGHGLIDPENDQGYWVPVDGSSTSAVRWVSNASITDQIRAMTARNVMVIADSCYSGSLMRSGMVTLRSGLTAEKKALRLNDDVKQLTRVAFSSGGIQPVIDSIDNSQHSVFTGALLDVLKNNKQLLDADSLATQVAHTVAVATKDNVKQVPRYAPLAAGGHEGGEFYFAPKKMSVSN